MLSENSGDGTAAPKKRRRRGIETEKKFVAAANEVFWDKGFGGSTIADIIAASGLSVGSFYHRFRDKEELLNVATDDVYRAISEEFGGLSFRREDNHDLFSLLYLLSRTGRECVWKHRGIYRATTEVANSRVHKLGAVTKLVPEIIQRVEHVIDGYSDQLQSGYDSERIKGAVQMIGMTAMYTSLRMGPHFPSDPQAFSRMMARAACGIMGYTGQTDTPAVEFHAIR